MKKVLVGALAMLLFLSGLNSTVFGAEQKTIRVGAFNNYPVIFQDKDGIVKGLYVDLLSEIGRREGINFEYVNGTWSEGLERIKSGEVDLLTSVGYTEERSQYINYTKTPLLTVWGELYALPTSDIDSILEADGKKIGVMKGDVNADNFRKLISGFGVNPEIVEFANYDDVFRAVSDKSVDAGVAGITFGMANQAKYKLKTTGIVFNPIDLFFTVASDKNQELLKTLDKYLTEWKRQDNSFYFQVKHKWMGGEIEEMENMPRWLLFSFIGLGVVLVIAMVFIVLLKQQVSRATKKIKQESLELKESDEKYKFLVDKMQEIAIIIDQGGVVKFVNKVTCKILGYTEEEMLGKSMENFLDENSYKKATEALKLRFMGMEQEGFEIMVKKKDGSMRIWQVAGESSPVNEEGRMVGLLVSAVDVTSRKDAEKELEKSKTILQAKVEELEKFQKLTVDRELKMAELKENMEKMKKEK